ncbi:MAG: glycosyltransferase family 4 protein [Spirochaetia bacterium]|nr:glycosyltransferase family 4 protein [Spirochaetia bacterium]
MNIGVYFPDVRPEAGGASSLLKTIQKEIKESKDTKHNYYFLYDGDCSEPLLTESDGNKYLNLSYYLRISNSRKIKNKIKRLLRKPIYPLNRFNTVAKEFPIDIFWFPSPVNEDLDYPYIYTVWDLGHRSTPFFPEVSRSGNTWDNREKQYTKMVYKASYVITGNEEGKKEILENYPMPPQKIRISPFPVASFCHGESIRPDFNIPKDFFFYPAQFWPHKNHICILEALKYLRDEKGITPTVFLTGSDKGNKTYIINKISEYKLENQVIFTGFLKDEELKYLYTHATGMIFASLMGPNNMPPIEATYLHCPVIITDLDGHKEQLGNTALYFTGYDYKDLASKMLILLKSKTKRTALIEKEKKLAKQFSKINYFTEIRKIVEEFSLIRNTWGTDFIHL